MAGSFRERVERLRSAARAYSDALDRHEDAEKTSAIYKRLIKLVDPDDIVKLTEAWLKADGNKKQKVKRNSVRNLERKA